MKAQIYHVPPQPHVHDTERSPDSKGNGRDSNTNVRGRNFRRIEVGYWAQPEVVEEVRNEEECEIYFVRSARNIVSVGRSERVVHGAAGDDRGKEAQRHAENRDDEEISASTEVFDGAVDKGQWDEREEELDSGECGLQVVGACGVEAGEERKRGAVHVGAGGADASVALNDLEESSEEKASVGAKVVREEFGAGFAAGEESR